MWESVALVRKKAKYCTSYSSLRNFLLVVLKRTINFHFNEFFRNQLEFFFIRTDSEIFRFRSCSTVSCTDTPCRFHLYGSAANAMRFIRHGPNRTGKRSLDVPPWGSRSFYYFSIGQSSMQGIPYPVCN